MSDEQRTWTLDDSARASNPGNVRVNLVRWFLHYPKWPLIWFSSLAVFAVLAWFIHWSFWILAVLLLALNWFYWHRVRDHFRHGCANPGVIVSLQPMLIAVSTDLTLGEGEYPVIKIIEKSLSTACGQVPQLGGRLPTVALYRLNMDPNAPHWGDVDPRPIDCATGDVAVMRGLMSTFNEDDWNQLHAWLRQVPQPYRPGLYFMQKSS